MRKHKFLIIGLGLLMTALVAFVAVADNELLIDIKAIETGNPESQTVHLQFLYKNDKGSWVVEGNIPAATVGELTYERDYQGPHRIEINKANWFCKNSNGGGLDIGDYSKVVIDEINVPAYKCTFTLPVFTLSMNFNVYGLESGTQTTFYVHQFDKNGTEIGVATDYLIGNTWDTVKSQDMLIDYAHSEIWQNGTACRFIAGENPANPTQIPTSMSMVYVTYNTVAENGCVLSLEAPVKPDIFILDIFAATAGLTESDGAKLHVLELKSANRSSGFLDTPYDIWKANSAFTQTMNNEYPDHTEMDVSVGGIAYPCKFEDGTTDIAKELDKIYVDFDYDANPPKCLLTLQPNGITLDINVSGLEFDPLYPLSDDPKLQYTVIGAEGSGHFTYTKALICSDKVTPAVDGICKETVHWVGATIPSGIKLTWHRIKNFDEPNTAICFYNGSANIPYLDIGELIIYGSDPGWSSIECHVE